MKYDFATVQLGGFTAPGLPLARWIEFFQLRILGQNDQNTIHKNAHRVNPARRRGIGPAGWRKVVENQLSPKWP